MKVALTVICADTTVLLFMTLHIFSRLDRLEQKIAAGTQGGGERDADGFRFDSGVAAPNISTNNDGNAMRFRFLNWLMNALPKRLKGGDDVSRTENLIAHLATEDRYSTCFWCKFTPWRPPGLNIDSDSGITDAPS